MLNLDAEVNLHYVNFASDNIYYVINRQMVKNELTSCSQSDANSAANAVLTSPIPAVTVRGLFD
jgi:hypothetical protein